MSIAGLSAIRNSLVNFYVLYNMSGQARISNFFQPLGKKRENTDVTKVDKEEIKKPKLVMKENCPKDDAQEEITSSPSSSPPLTPDQKSKMKQNQLAAKMKLAEKKTFGLVQHMGTSWFKALEPEFSKPYFEKLATFVQNERKNATVYPPAHQVFTFTTACEIKDVKVVILGQDPYHGPRQAHGLCFSVQQGVPPPPSLINIYKELENDIEGFKRPNHGYLQGWSNQGVLLLNAVLTVKAANANSHKDRGWEKFTDAIIAWINNNSRGVVFMLWGSYAQKKGACIDKKRHHILKGVHPSPLSAHRGFLGCKHFTQCNNLLQKQGQKTIDWTHLPQQ